MRPLLALILVACLLAPARTGSIRGTMRVPPAPAQDATFHPYAGRASSLAAPVHRPRGLVTGAVVYVASLPASAAADTSFHGNHTNVEIPVAGDATLDVSF